MSLVLALQACHGLVPRLKSRSKFAYKLSLPAAAAKKDAYECVTSNSMTFSEPSASEESKLGDDLSFTVFGEPVTLQRHRNAGGFGRGQSRMYNPSATQQKNFAKALMSSDPTVLREGPMLGPLEANLNFYFTRPQSHYRTGKYVLILLNVLILLILIESWAVSLRHGCDNFY